jgi:hypothetical protein
VQAVFFWSHEFIASVSFTFHLLLLGMIRYLRPGARIFFILTFRFLPLNFKVKNLH